MGAGLPQLQRPTSPTPSSNVIQLGKLQITPARTGDHLGIRQLLQEVFRGPSAAEFQFQQDEPGYSPGNRFIARDGQRIVGHARVSLRRMLVGGEWLPVARVFDVCVLDEYRKQGVASHLLQACEQLAREQGAALLQARASHPPLLERLGWFPCGRNVQTLVGPREVLAELERRRWEEAARHQPSDDLPQLSRARNPLTVRRWKQTEHAAVQRLYTEATTGLNGPLARDDAYWRWLIARSAYDWFYVAIDGPDRTLFDDIQGHIVGYMFLKGHRLIELMASPKSDRAAEALLARACRDAVEQSVTPLRLDLPSDHELYPLLAASSAKTVSRASESEPSLAKVLDLPQLAAAALSGAPENPRISIEIRDDAATIPLYRAAENPVPAHWSLEGSRLAPEPGGARPQVTCSLAVMTQLLIGHVTVGEALETDQLRIASAEIRQLFETLLGNRPLWFASLDDLLA